MNRALKIAFLLTGGCSAAISLAGCKTSACPDTIGPDGGTETHPDCVQVQPTIEYKDMTPRLGNAPWTTGQTITITNQNGDVTVTADSTAADQVQTSGVGFTRDTSDDTGRANATNVLTKMANPTVMADASGVVVSAPGMKYDGYHLTVHIPAAFDGAITVTQNAGEVTLHSAVAAKSTTIHAGAGSVNADNLTGAINISSGAGDLTVSATPSGPGNVLQTDVGDINVSIGMANLKISATPAGGMVTFPTAWGTPTLSTDMKTSSITIGDGSGALNASTGLGSIFFQ